MEFKQLVDCHFSGLKTLKMPLLSGTITSIDRSRTTFINNHPTIEELSWYPIGPVEFSSDSLPSIKRLQAGRQVIEALEIPMGNPLLTDSKSPAEKGTRRIEYLDVISIGPENLTGLTCLHRASLRMLNLRLIGSLESVHYLADVFPNITWLSLPPVHLPPDQLHPLKFDLVRACVLSRMIR
jgi:hypothetical protein